MRPSLRHSEIESQRGQRTPKAFDVRAWIAIGFIIAALIMFVI